MTSTPDTVLGIELQAQNDNTGAWWANANQVFQSLVDSIAKEVPLATTGGDSALTVVAYAVDQARCAIVRIGAGQTLLSLARITTARARLYFVTNETIAGAFAVQFGGNVSNLLTITRGCGAWVRVRSDGTTTFAGPLVNLTTGAIDGASLASGAFLLGANNLSDLANAAAGRTNLGLAIGSNVEAWSANLDAWSAIATSTKQAHTANLDFWSSVATAVAALGYTPANVASNLSDLANAGAARTNLGVAYAAKSDQVAASSAALVVSPSVQQSHPSAVYAHGRVASDGTLQAGFYGISSVSRTGTGTYVVTLSTTAANSNGTVTTSPRQGGIDTRCAAMDSTTQFTVTVTNSSTFAPADGAFAFVFCGTPA